MKTKAEPTLSIPSKPTLRALSICTAVVNGWGLRWKLIAGRGRSQSVSAARRVCGYLLRQRTTMSFEEIGTLCGGRDHSTAIYWVEKTKRECAENPTIATMVRSIEEQAERLDKIAHGQLNEEEVAQ